MLLGEGERWLTVFSAFLDESGTRKDSPVVSVAGFYGNSDQWGKFRELWRPHSDGFHALRCDSLFPALFSAIESSEISGLYITLGKDDYKNLATPHMKSFLGNPYAICSFMCAMSVCNEVNAPLSVALEQGQPNVSFVKRILEEVMDAGESCIVAVATVKKADFIELHPADFVSHCASQFPDHKEWLLRLSRLKHAHLDERQLTKAAPEITAIVKKNKNQKLKNKRQR